MGIGVVGELVVDELHVGRLVISTWWSHRGEEEWWSVSDLHQGWPGGEEWVEGWGKAGGQGEYEWWAVG